MGSSFSLLCTVLCGVSRRSGLGPILFLLYTAELLLLTESHGFCPHLYADNMQMYMFCAVNETLSLQIYLLTCIILFGEWMRSNHLQLNAAKTGVLWSITRRRLHQYRVSCWYRPFCVHQP